MDLNEVMPSFVVVLLLKVMPVFFITILGATFATTALVRACVRYTDVS